MDNKDVEELFAMYLDGKIDGWELQSALDIGGFDGDLLDFL